MTIRKLGGCLETVTPRQRGTERGRRRPSAALAAASLLVLVAACGGKVIEDAPSHGCPTGSEPAATSTSSPVASPSPSAAPSSSPAPPSGTVPPVAATDAGAPALDGGLSGKVVTLDGGVLNDGEPGSLVATARSTAACTVPSAVSAVASPDGGFPMTSIGRELAACESPAGFFDCVSNDGVQCSGTSSVVLLFDLSCVDECAPGEYVVAMDRVDLLAYPEPPELVAASCHEIPFIVGDGGNGRTYCCPCGD